MDELIRIIIRNEISSFPLEINPYESIAAVKALYQDSGKCLSNPSNIISLLYKGKELEDEKTLAESHITDGAILINIPSQKDSFRSVNYKKLADSIRTKKQHEVNIRRMMQQDNIWATDEDGVLHRLGYDQSLISKMKNRSFGNTKSKIHSSKPKWELHTRTFFNQLAVRVNGNTYHVIPCMEGRWNGEVFATPSDEISSQVCATELLYREEEGVWSQRQTRTSLNGYTNITHFWIKPVADGVLKIETDDSSLRHCDTTLQEIGNNIALITSTSKRTGRIRMVETITFLDSYNRSRIVQKFDESGDLYLTLISKEQRVVDAVSGAMERYDERY